MMPVHLAADKQRAHLILPQSSMASGQDVESRLNEAEGLVEALDLDLTGSEVVATRRINAGLFFGAGRAETIRSQLEASGAEILVVDADLTPVQQRNLEQAVGAKVVDRSGLILEIFGRRARSREGKLQVELARLDYERSRLVRTWTHLERQRGGLGKTGGPGETQIELDRRLISRSVERLRAELAEVRRTRGLQRRARERAGMPVVAFVGYTNAGKSTLFNHLTGAGVLAKDMPFATLDTTSRAVAVPGGAVVLTDTVGFITDLPTELVEAFRATLEEVRDADVIVHVRDIAHESTEAQRRDVLAVLDRLGVEEGPKLIEAWNKMDLLPPEQAASRRARAPREGAVALSARTGEGIEALLRVVGEKAFGPMSVQTFRLAPADGRSRALIGRHGRIIAERMEGDELAITAEVPASLSLPSREVDG